MRAWTVTLGKARIPILESDLATEREDVAGEPVGAKVGNIHEDVTVWVFACRNVALPREYGLGCKGRAGESQHTHIRPLCPGNARADGLVLKLDVRHAFGSKRASRSCVKVVAINEPAVVAHA